MRKQAYSLPFDSLLNHQQSTENANTQHTAGVYDLINLCLIWFVGQFSDWVGIRKREKEKLIWRNLKYVIWCQIRKYKNNNNLAHIYQTTDIQAVVLMSVVPISMLKTRNTVVSAQISISSRVMNWIVQTN